MVYLYYILVVMLVYLMLIIMYLLAKEDLADFKNTYKRYFKKKN